MTLVRHEMDDHEHTANASTQQLYLCGSSEAMDEMSMPVCTSITFRQPSTPVLRTWRLSVITTQGAASESRSDHSDLASESAVYFISVKSVFIQFE